MVRCWGTAGLRRPHSSCSKEHFSADGALLKSAVWYCGATQEILSEISG